MILENNTTLASGPASMLPSAPGGGPIRTLPADLAAKKQSADWEEVGPENGDMSDTTATTATTTTAASPNKARATQADTASTAPLARSERKAMAGKAAPEPHSRLAGIPTFGKQRAGARTSSDEDSSVSPSMPSINRGDSPAAESADKPSTAVPSSKDALTAPESKQQQQQRLWGRAYQKSLFLSVGSAFMMVFSPLLVLYFYVANQVYGGSLLGPIIDMAKVANLTASAPLGSSDASYFRRDAGFCTIEGDATSADESSCAVYSEPTTLGNLFSVLAPKLTVKGAGIFFAWLSFQALLFMCLPGKIGHGQLTPAGHILKYKVNGLNAWIVTHVLFVALSALNLMSPTIIFDNWGPLLVMANMYGFFMTGVGYLKAWLAPTHPGDVKFSQSLMYDLFMGAELNPRIGEWFDFKLFHNGRPGIVAWTLINLSCAAKQYQLYGTVTDSMVLVNLLQAIYVLDFFKNEDWYLRTIDIAHDHWGFYLAWGDSVWLPFMYTLQAVYLVHQPVQLGVPAAMGVLALGLGGYAIFRAANNQKDRFRAKNGECTIWGKPAKALAAPYTTADGTQRNSLLLLSGFWGVARHFNYVGDLMLSFAFCLACGVNHLLPYFYIVYMAILLLHRIERDNDRCRQKYGAVWDKYCALVKYKLVPGVY